MISRLTDWLGTDDELANADLIFVLAGRPIRKIYGLRLFREGRASWLVLSTARFEIRHFRNLLQPAREPVDLLPIAAATPPPQRHFFVTFHAGKAERVSATDIERIPVGLFGTLGEIEALASYLNRRHEIRSVLVVTSGAHARRVRLCCERILPRGVAHRVIAVPASFVAESEAASRRGTESVAGVLLELLKLVVYRIVLLVPRGTGEN